VQFDECIFMLGIDSDYIGNYLTFDDTAHFYECVYNSITNVKEDVALGA